MPAAPPAMQGKPVRLIVEPILPVTLIGLRAASSDKRRQTVGIAFRSIAAWLLRPAIALVIGMLLAMLSVRLRFTAGILLGIAHIRLTLGRMRLRLAAVRHVTGGVIFDALGGVLAPFIIGTEIRLALPELVLGRRDHPEIVLGVLVVVLRGNRVA
jgi:hypothetical protein